MAAKYTCIELKLTVSDIYAINLSICISDAGSGISPYFWQNVKYLRCIDEYVRVVEGMWPVRTKSSTLASSPGKTKNKVISYLLLSAITIVNAPTMAHGAWGNSILAE